MPAMPMKLAALRYSPEMALAFQPTLTLRPATKKSLAVFDCRAERNPIQIVTPTVTALKARIYGSTMGQGASRGEERGPAEPGWPPALALAPPAGAVRAVTSRTSASSSAMERR